MVAALALSVRNKTAQELGVSRDEIEVSLTNLVKTELAAQSGPEGGMIALTPFGREFLRKDGLRLVHDCPGSHALHVGIQNGDKAIKID
jgi:hypothetical protein